MKDISFHQIFRFSKTNIDNYATIVADLPSVLLTYFIVRFTNITANFITLMSLLAGLCSFYFIFQEKISHASILYYLSYVLDFSDGKVARIQSAASSKGKVYDILVDRILFILLTFGYSVYLIENNENMLITYAFFASCLIFLFLDLMELIIVVERYYAGKPHIKHDNNFHYISKLSNLKMWIPRKLFILWVLFFLFPISNFNPILISFCFMVLSLFIIKNFYNIFKISM